MSQTQRPRVAECFAGIGLVRLALEDAGFGVVWANDIEPSKYALYAANFDPKDFRLMDIRHVRGDELPQVELATASFPCTDLSLAGNRAGLSGEQSSMFWEFARVLREMCEQRPMTVLLENVSGFATSHGGRDLYAVIEALNAIGYWCDLFVVDARHFVPQSRPRMFIVGTQGKLDITSDWRVSELRPLWVHKFTDRHPELQLQALRLTLPPEAGVSLDQVIEQLPGDSERWWPADRLKRFLTALSPINARRLEALRGGGRLQWRTAYRRTRRGEPMWEIRDDPIAGCLRTARGGSSKQAVVEAGEGVVRVRWMTPREYAALQGAPTYHLGEVTDNMALFGFGDAVCVPVIAWIARAYLWPVVTGALPLKRLVHA